jgi:transitional endoplasmic reticulum ATPase
MTDINRPEGHSAVVEAANQVTRTALAIDSAVNHDGKPGAGITVPKTMTLRNAVRKLEEYADAEASKTKIRHCIESMHALPAALAFRKVLADKYGVDFAKPVPGFFGVSYPVDITVPVAPNTIERITLGQFTLDGMDVETNMGIKDGVPRLMITITTTNANKAAADALINHTFGMRDAWQGQCLVFDTSNDEVRTPNIVEPKFTLDNIALNPAEEAALTMFVNQIRHHDNLARNHNIPFKRGVLMYGPYGTGKTLAAAVSMAEARAAGITVIQERQWSNLHNTMRLARDMQPCLVFCEDIDRLDSRSLTNILDDATLKHCAVSLVVTTNYPEKLDPALTRTGRLDISIGFELPERETRAHILAINDAPYFNDDIANATDNFTGSDLAEVAKRATINAVAANRGIDSTDVLGAAHSMRRPPAYVEPDSIGKALSKVADALGISAVQSTVDDIDSTVDRIADNM